MRSIVDSNGTRWEIEEVSGGYGVGAGAVFKPLPEPTRTAVIFKSTDGDKVVKTSRVGAVDKMSDEELLDLLEDPTE